MVLINSIRRACTSIGGLSGRILMRRWFFLPPSMDRMRHRINTTEQIQ